MSAERPGLSPLARHLLGLAAYYAVVVAVSLLLSRLFPQITELWHSPALKSGAKAGDLISNRGPQVVLETRRMDLALSTTLSIVASVAMAVPLAWVYLLTRRRKGFTQSLAHTLILLPIGIAGVVTLVQDSLALAFSLAGIVAAVRFRNTLEDTKDTVYIFVATGLGIAAGVGGLVIGFVTSVLFNVVVLVLWWTEFGRAPANLEGSPAFRRLERARALADGGGEFVASLDKEVLPALSPGQLESLASRAWRRRQLKDDLPLPDRRFPFQSLLVVHATEVEPVQLAVESVLIETAKRWELAAVLPEPGGARLEYLLKLRKSADRNAFLVTLRARCGPQLAGIELR